MLKPLRLVVAATIIFLFLIIYQLSGGSFIGSFNKIRYDSGIGHEPTLDRKHDLAHDVYPTV